MLKIRTKCEKTRKKIKVAERAKEKMYCLSIIIMIIPNKFKKISY